MLGIIIGVIFWVIFLIVCVNIGKEKNRNGLLWGLFFGPLGLLILAILPKIEVSNNSSSTPYVNQKRSTGAADNSNLPVFMRRQLEETSTRKNTSVTSKDLENLPRVIAKEEEKNTYYENNVRSKKWICGKCSSINIIKDDICKNCGNEKGILKMNT